MTLFQMGVFFISLIGGVYALFNVLAYYISKPSFSMRAWTVGDLKSIEGDYARSRIVPSDHLIGASSFDTRIGLIEFIRDVYNNNSPALPDLKNHTPKLPLEHLPME